MILTPDSKGPGNGALPPTGSHVATFIGAVDQFGVTTPKFENPNETEIIDQTTLHFGFRGNDGQIYYVRTFPMRISGNSKSKLINFLTQWFGNPWDYNKDYCDLCGEPGLLTVSHRQSKDGSRTYANIVGIAPVPDQLKDQVLPLNALERPDGQPWDPSAESTEECPY